MLIVLTGGSGSGKSKMAEEIIQLLCPGPKVYLATMQSMDDEMVRRIEKHRNMREGKYFTTLEQGHSLKEIVLPEEGKQGILLECMSNLIANEMYAREALAKELSEEKLAAYILEEIRFLGNQTEHLVIVTNDVFGELPLYAETDHYLRIFGMVNQALAQDADVFLEVVYGLPVCLKSTPQAESLLKALFAFIRDGSML